MTLGLAFIACSQKIQTQQPQTPEIDGPSVPETELMDYRWFGTYMSAHDDIKHILLYERRQLELPSKN